MTMAVLNQSSVEYDQLCEGARKLGRDSARQIESEDSNSRTGVLWQGLISFNLPIPGISENLKVSVTVQVRTALNLLIDLGLK